MKYDLTVKSFAFGFFYFAIAKSPYRQANSAKQLYSIFKKPKKDHYWPIDLAVLLNIWYLTSWNNFKVW